jgi:c-di-GMP-binding flagellar brake protein YcgR
MDQQPTSHYSTQLWPTTRQFERVQVDIPVAIEASGRRYRGWSVNIGEGGFAMTVPAPLRKGDEISASIELNDSCKLTVRATVRHGNGFRFGCEFLSISAEQQQAVRSFVSSGSRPRRRMAASSRG